MDVKHELIVSGEITIRGDWDTLHVGNEILGEQISESEFEGLKVFLRYFISDEPMATIEEAEEGLVRTVTGTLEAEAFPVCGSEWTGQYDFQQGLTVGGHCLIQELTSHEGKYVLIHIRGARPN